MKQLLLVSLLLFSTADLCAGLKCEIRGHLIDKKKNKPFGGSFRFENSKGDLIEQVYTDEEGLFIIHVKDTGLFRMVRSVSSCREDEQYIEILNSTPYNVELDFVSSKWDPNCKADNQGPPPEIVPRFGFTRGWRGMLDASLALRMKPGSRRHRHESHSIALGAEWNYGFNRYLFGFKAGYTYLNECFDFTGITAGVNAVYFVDRSDAAWYVQPQLAYEGLGLFEILIQYNIPLNSPVLDYRVNQFSAGMRFWLD